MSSIYKIIRKKVHWKFELMLLNNKLVRTFKIAFTQYTQNNQVYAMYWKHIVTKRRDQFSLIAISQAATGGVLQEKMFLEVSQNSQESTCARVPIEMELQNPTNEIITHFFLILTAIKCFVCRILLTDFY